MIRKLVPLAAVAASLTVPALIGIPAAGAAVAPSAAHATRATSSGWPCTWFNCVKGDIFGYVEASPSLNVRTAPCASSACGVSSQLPYGTQVAIRCYTRGDTVTGWGGTTNEWDLILDHGEGFLGWVSDAWINTGGDTATLVAECP
jgi:hypothetical protein